MIPDRKTHDYEEPDPGVDAIKAALHQVMLDYGPNLGCLNRTDLDVVALRLLRAAQGSS